MKITKIKTGDTVLVKVGKDRLKTGKVMRLLKDKGKVVVEGANIYKKHIKPSQKYPQGGIIDANMPINVSNIEIICQSCKKATRIKFKNTGREKRRVCVKCGEVVDAS